MGTDLSKPFALYPMVEEGEATGVVAGVYAQLLESLPFVPSLFKSLALCPGYLVLAAEQAAAVMSSEAFGTAAQQLSDSVAPTVRPPEDEQVRQTMARFVAPLGRMLLLSCGLLLAVQDSLDSPPAPGRTPAPRPARPDEQQPSPWQASDLELYGQIRSSLQTPIINTIWRTLAGEDRLQVAWRSLAPQVEASRPVADALQQRAVDSARRLSWPVAATPAALAAAGVADAAPGMAAVLDAYVKTLPRVLVLAASVTRT